MNYVLHSFAVLRIKSSQDTTWVDTMRLTGSRYTNQRNGLIGLVVVVTCRKDTILSRSVFLASRFLLGAAAFRPSCIIVALF